MTISKPNTVTSSCSRKSNPYVPLLERMGNTGVARRVLVDTCNADPDWGVVEDVYKAPLPSHRKAEAGTAVLVNEPVFWVVVRFEGRPSKTFWTNNPLVLGSLIMAHQATVRTCCVCGSEQPIVDDKCAECGAPCGAR